MNGMVNNKRNGEHAEEKETEKKLSLIIETLTSTAPDGGWGRGERGYGGAVCRLGWIVSPGAIHRKRQELAQDRTKYRVKGRSRCRGRTEGWVVVGAGAGEGPRTGVRVGAGAGAAPRAR